MATENDVVFDPFAIGFTDDPYPQYQRLREAGPVHRHPLGFWMLTQYAEVSDLLRFGLSVEDRNLGPSPMRDLLEQVTRFDTLALDGPVEWNGRINLRGPARLPVAAA